MFTDYWTVTTNYPGPEVFRRSPFCSYYFVAPTVVLALAMLSAGVVVARCDTALRLNSEAWMGAGCMAMVVLWARGLRDWLRIRSVVLSSDLTPGTPLYVALGVAAAQICYGLTFLGLVGGGLFGVIGHLSKAVAR